MSSTIIFSFFFFFTAPATTEIYTLSLHDALPILAANLTVYEQLDLFCSYYQNGFQVAELIEEFNLNRIAKQRFGKLDRKSTRLNSSHVRISYAVFCLKKKKKKITIRTIHLTMQLH